VAMTLIGSSGTTANEAFVEVYRLIAPATGANNVTATRSGPGDGRMVMICRSFTGVHQTTPEGTVATAYLSAANPTVAVSSAVDELVVDFTTMRAGTPVVGAGQTQRANQVDANAINTSASSDEAGATSVTMSWTGGSGFDSCIVGVPIKPASSGTDLYFLDSAASGSNFGQLQIGGSAPSAATTTTGWTVDTVAATNYALLDYGVERLSTTFSGTAEPAGNPDNTLGDCFRSTNVMTGDFATGVWTITVPVIAVTGASGQDGRVRVRLWKSANATGTTPTEITSGAVVGTAVTNLATGAEQTSVATTSSITGFSMTSEYLFVQIAWEITGAAT